jgi:hypothetical protein
MWMLDQIKKAHRNRISSESDEISWMLDYPLWRDLGIHEVEYDIHAIVSVIQTVLFGLGLEKIKCTDSRTGGIDIVLVGGGKS